MSAFVFESYEFDSAERRASFHYTSGGKPFTESVYFAELIENYDTAALDRALKLSFLVIGTSYYKAFPTRDVDLKGLSIDEWQADFLNHVYQEGLSQYAYENSLERSNLAQFIANGSAEEGVQYNGSGVIALQSGGKDSLLLAKFLQEKSVDFSSLYITSGSSYPHIIDTLGRSLLLTKRLIDKEGLIAAIADGAKNGHIPVTFVVLSIALIQAVLSGKNTVLASIGHEGEEPHAMVGDLAITHQWSKTWTAEQLFSDYVTRYVSPDLRVGSPLRRFTELRIAELFVDKAWEQYGHSFSSCNRINYQQGVDNTTLKWCGECPKCANSYLLFAPFVEPSELKSLFNGQDLFEKPLLQDTFKGLLGVDGFEKPFECIGEIDELRYAYHHKQPGYGEVSFTVPEAAFDYQQLYPYQQWTDEFIG